MGAIAGYAEKNWYDPYLGQGIYMLVVYTTDGKYVGFYVGKSNDIGRRWRDHLQNWFIEPHDGYWIPVNADDFLADPVGTFNNQQLKKGLEDRAKIQERILENTWFCFAEVNDLRPLAYTGERRVCCSGRTEETHRHRGRRLHWRRRSWKTEWGPTRQEPFSFAPLIPCQHASAHHSLQAGPR